MAYTDEELKHATQIAYADLQYAYEAYRKLGETPPFTIRELMNVEIDGADVERIHKLPEELLEWKIVDYYDTNDETGFYGCLIETSDNEAIVAFRGSENMAEFTNMDHDWIKADFALLVSKETIQQGEIEKFLQQMIDEKELDKYTSIASTGHSLGGNCSDHFTILTAKYGVSDKITQSVSFDGPGFSDEYIEENKEAIAKVAGKMVHYRWSLISSCLQDLPGVEQTFLGINENLHQDSFWDNFFYKLIVRHDTASLVFDENGKAQRGEQDPASKFISTSTKGLDHMPSAVGTAIYTGLGGIILAGSWSAENMFDEEGNLTTFGNSLIIGAIGFVSVAGVDKIFIGAGALITGVVGMFISGYVYEKAYQAVVSLVEAVGNALEWTKEQCAEMIDSLITQWNAIINEFQLKFNAGYQYATNNPNISVDTDSLREYANRLYTVNQTINTIDSNLNYLYGRVGFLDLWDLIQADILTGYNWRLKQCENYLNNTANSFDTAENNIKNSFE